MKSFFATAIADRLTASRSHVKGPTYGQATGIHLFEPFQFLWPHRLGFWWRLCFLDGTSRLRRFNLQIRILRMIFDDDESTTSLGSRESEKATPKRPTATAGKNSLASSNPPSNLNTQPWLISSCTRLQVTSPDGQLAKWTGKGVSGRIGRSSGPKQFDGGMPFWKPVLTPCNNKQSKRFTSAANITTLRFFITSKNMGWCSRQNQLTSRFFACKKSEIRVETNFIASALNGALGLLASTWARDFKWSLRFKIKLKISERKPLKTSWWHLPALLQSGWDGIPPPSSHEKGGSCGVLLLNNGINWAQVRSSKCLEKRWWTILANASHNVFGYCAVSRLFNDPSGCFVPMTDWWVPLGLEQIWPKDCKDGSDVEKIHDLSTSML